MHDSLRSSICAAALLSLVACAAPSAAQVSALSEHAARPNPPVSVRLSAISASMPKQAIGSILDLARITKKPFGIYITSETSPVSPERFRGYHTGADFELYAGEDAHELMVPALCDGTIMLARTVSGYGGVMIERCMLNGERVTVLYGHLDAKSFVPKPGAAVKQGQFLAHLGTGYTSETDGERAHLHLSVHRGNKMILAGYVQKRSALASWIDPLTEL